jgi:hypothetical protein
LERTAAVLSCRVSHNRISVPRCERTLVGKVTLLSPGGACHTISDQPDGMIASSLPRASKDDEVSSNRALSRVPYGDIGIGSAAIHPNADVRSRSQRKPFVAAQKQPSRSATKICSCWLSNIPHVQVKWGSPGNPITESAFTTHRSRVGQCGQGLAALLRFGRHPGQSTATLPRARALDLSVCMVQPVTAISLPRLKSTLASRAQGLRGQRASRARGRLAAWLFSLVRS